MNLFSFFKKKPKRCLEQRILMLEASINILDESIVEIRKHLKQLEDDVPITKEFAELIKNQFSSIVDNFSIIKETSESTIPSINSHKEAIELLAAQTEMNTMLLIQLTKSLLDGNIITEDDVKPQLLN